MGRHRDKLKAPIKYYGSLIDHAKTNKVAYIIFIALNIACCLTIVWCSIEKRWQEVFFGVLAMILLLIPLVVKKTFRVQLPTVLESVAYFFVFFAAVLGEIASFYTKVPLWDTMLHTVCGFIFAAFGFCLFDILNQNRKSKFELSPIFLTLLAFCFSITIGTLWEFFEFGMDLLTHADMQKDVIINEFGSVTLNPNGLNKAIFVKDIGKTLIYDNSGNLIQEINGYLDIGLFDTIKDMFVNFVGAFVFSIFGYLYINTRGRGKLASQFIPVFIEIIDEGKIAEKDAEVATIVKQLEAENSHREESKSPQ